MNDKAQRARLSYSIEEAVDVTGFARTRIYKAIADGSLSTFKIGRRRMISDHSLRDFIVKLERDSKAAA
jgi:excisionase family DNA binding protein